jgi:signal transduction histidine kinase
MVLAASSLLLDFLTPDFLAPPERPDLVLTLSTVLLSLACPTVGALVASRLPANPTGWIFCGMGLLYGARRFAVSYSDYALLYRPSWPGGEYAAWVSTWLGFSGLAALGVLLVLLFPEGRLLSRRWRAVAWATVCGAVMVGLGEALRFGPLPGYYYVRNPVGVAGTAVGALPAYRLFEISIFVGGTLLSAGCLACLVSLTLRLRRSAGEVRQQLNWLACAAVPAVIGAAVIMVDRSVEEFTLLSLDRPVRPALRVAENLEFFVRDDRILGPLAELRLEITFELLAALALFVVPVFTGVTILRYHLYDIDVVINRTLVYGALTAAVATFYVLLVAVFGALFRIGTEGNLAISLLATGLVAVLFQPLRERLQRAVNRLMYGERQEPYAALSRLGRRLEATLEPGVVLPTIVETVAGSLRIPHAAIALNGEDGFTTVANYGSPAGEPTIVPLVRQDETVGRLILSPRTPNEPFSPADQRLLEDLARQAGAAIHAVKLTADLQRSRERLITAREEERRRLRRDLHDGLGPTLAGLALGLDVARRLTGRESEEASGLLSRLEGQTKEAVADIRRLVYGLRPPALDDLGLVPAIRQQAEALGFVEGEQHGGPDPVFCVEAPQKLPHLPAAVEVAAYRIAQEALSNVAQHALARVCRVRLSIDEGVLDLVVEDDGVGIHRNRSAGVGLSSMRERAEELGGTCSVEAASTGGTRVFVRLPVPSPGKDERGIEWSGPSVSS